MEPNLLERSGRAPGRRLARRAVATLAAVLCAVAPASAANAGRADGPRATPADPSVLLSGSVDRPAGVREVMPIPKASRTRYLEVAPKALAAAVAGGPTGEDDWREPTSRCRSLRALDVRVELFDGRRVTLEGLSAERCALVGAPIDGIAPEQIAAPSEYTSWTGQAKRGEDILAAGSFTIVSAVGGPPVVFGTIDDALGHHVVQPVTQDGLEVMYDGVASGGGGNDAVPVPGRNETLAPQDPPMDPELAPTDAGAVDASSTRTVTVTALYTNGLTSSQATYAASAGIAAMNSALANSQVAVHVELVGSATHSNYTEASSMETDLDRLQSTTDGYLNEIHLMRAAWHADLGMLIRPHVTASNCGRAYLPWTVLGGASSGFSVVAAFGCDSANVAHELGHNLGSDHNPEDAPPSHEVLSYAFGHIVSGKGHDVMAYDDHCGAPCPTKLQYADPDIDLIGFPGTPSGTSTRRAADTISTLSWAVSQYQPVASNDTIWLSHANRTHSSINVAASTGADQEAPYGAVQGNFDGDSRGDIFWYFPDSGPDWIAYYNGTGESHVDQAHSVFGSYRPFAGDFDGDHRDDVLWYAPGGAPDPLWWGKPGKVQLGDPGHVRTMTVNGSYAPVSGDFDGDGRDDILWYAPSGVDSIWWGQPSRSTFGSVTSSVSLPSGLSPVSGDFDGDGRDDLLAYGAGPTADSIWWGQSTRSSFGSLGHTSSRSINGTYHPVAGDFDHDGRSDVLLYAPGTATDPIWWGHASRTSFGPGSQTYSSITGTYEKQIVGDFNGDGTDDIYWFAYA